MKRLFAVVAAIGLLSFTGCGGDGETQTDVQLSDPEAALVGTWVQEWLMFVDDNGVVTQTVPASYYGIDCKWVLAADKTFERRRSRNGEFFLLLKGTWSVDGKFITFVYTEGATGDATIQYSQTDSDHWYLVNNQEAGRHWEAFVRQ
ncbi:MAG: DUF5004 domain-containing protein [bacterium]